MAYVYENGEYRSVDAEDIKNAAEEKVRNFNNILNGVLQEHADKYRKECARSAAIGTIGAMGALAMTGEGCSFAGLLAAGVVGTLGVVGVNDMSNKDAVTLSCSVSPFSYGVGVGVLAGLVGAGVDHLVK